MKKFLAALFAALFLAQAWANGAACYDAQQAKRATHKVSSTKPRPARYSATLFQGSLKSNIVRIAHQYGWNTVVWNTPEDYTWVGTTRFYGDSLPNILARVLIKYPLQAQFYQGNHVLAIVPRNLP